METLGKTSANAHKLTPSPFRWEGYIIPIGQAVEEVDSYQETHKKSARTEEHGKTFNVYLRLFC